MPPLTPAPPKVRPLPARRRSLPAEERARAEQQTWAAAVRLAKPEPPALVADAPFSLVSYQELESQAAAIDGAVSTGQMPKAPYSLSAAEQTTLLAWIEAGAHGVPVAACP